MRIYDALVTNGLLRFGIAGVAIVGGALFGVGWILRDKGHRLVAGSFLVVATLVVVAGTAALLRSAWV